MSKNIKEMIGLVELFNRCLGGAFKIEGTYSKEKSAENLVCSRESKERNARGRVVNEVMSDKQQQ